MVSRKRVLAIPVLLILGALALAAALTPCLSVVTATPGLGPDAGARKKPAKTPCSGVRKT